MRAGIVLALPLVLTGAAVAQPAAAPPATPAPAAPLRPAVPAPTATAPIGAAPAAPVVAPANELPPADTPATPLKKGPVTPPAPLTRTRSSVAILQALDKVTAETIRFEAPIGQPVRYKTLVFTVRACETSAADEPVPDFAAYVLVDSQPIPAPGKGVPPARQVFRGWMYASSPGLNPLQHPVYDAWVIACKATIPATPRPTPRPAARPAPAAKAAPVPVPAPSTAPAPKT
jgi:hypothetical protein